MDRANVFTYRGLGSTTTQTQHLEGIRRMDLYKQWFLETVMQVGMMNTVVVMQSEDVKPMYRDDAPP